jgi:hypothetical protein
MDTSLLDLLNYNKDKYKDPQQIEDMNQAIAEMQRPTLKQGYSEPVNEWSRELPEESAAREVAALPTGEPKYTGAWLNSLLGKASNPNFLSPMTEAPIEPSLGVGDITENINPVPSMSTSKKVTREQVDKILNKQASAAPIWSALTSPEKHTFSDDEMASALEQRRSNLLMDVFANAGLQAGHSISTGKVAGAPTLSQANLDLSGLPVTELLEKRKSTYDKFTKEKEMGDKMEAADPNSQHSVAYRNLAQTFMKLNNLPTTAVDGLSAEQIEKRFPMISNIITAKMAQDSKKELARESKEAKDQVKSEKTDLKIDKLAKELKEDMDPDKGRTGNFGLVSGKVLAAERMQTLVDAFPDKNLDPIAMEELALGLANMLSPTSGGSRAQVHALVPQTKGKSVAQIKQWFMDAPYGASQQDFVHRLADTIHREKEMALEQLNRIRSPRLEAHATLKKLSPDTYTKIVSRYGIDPTTNKPVKTEKIQPTFTPGQESGINRVMEANDISREQAVEALKKAGKL